MDKLNNVWAVADNSGAISELTAGAALFGENVTLVFCGGKELATGAKRAFRLGEKDGASFTEYIPAIVKLVKENRPQLVFFQASKNGRLAASAVAAAVNTNVMNDPVELILQDGKVINRRMVYGGTAILTEKSAGETVVCCVGSGIFAKGEAQIAQEVIDVSCSGATGIKFVEKRQRDVKPVNLKAAKNVVGVGRGLGDAENLTLATALAQAIHGEVGCSRPIAEEEKWLPRETYIGVSGIIIKPEMYIACGISGQIQHIVGVNSAKTIVAINKDKKAPIFDQCDYGIVGDLVKVLPALTKKFSE